MQECAECGDPLPAKPVRSGGLPYCSKRCGNKAWNRVHRDEQTAKKRAWHAAHRETANSGRLARYLAKREETLPKFRAYYQENRERQRELGRQWFADHRDEANARRNQHYYEHKQENKPVRREKRYAARLATPWAKLLDSAKGRAVRKNVPFTLTAAWASERWTGMCELTGHPFSVSMDGKPGGRSYSPSIDRVKPALGYVPDNCRFILYGINRFKGEMTDDEMFTMARLLLTVPLQT